MKKNLLIRIPPLTSTIDENMLVQWGQFSSSGELNGDVHVSPVHQLRQEWLSLQPETKDDVELAPDQIILLMAGDQVLHRNIKINSGQRKHLATALPYLIEEYVVENIESLHIANSLDRKLDIVSISAITHEKMQGLLALFEQHHIYLDQVVAEVQLLEAELGFTTLLLDTTSVVLTVPGESSVAVDYGAVSFALEGCQTTDEDSSNLDTLTEEEDQHRLSQIKLIVPEGGLSVATRQVDELSGWLEEQGWLVDRLPLSGSVFEFFAKKYFSAKMPNLLVDLRQGAYQCSRKVSLRWRRWRPLLAIVSCWLIIELGLSIAGGMLFQHKAKELWSQTISSYLAVFPQDQQAKSAQANQMMSFNIKRLLESKLKNAGNTKKGEPFLPLLQKVSSVSATLGNEAGITHKSLDFNSAHGQLTMEIQADNLELVDKFLAKLKSSGLKARLENANQVKEGVTARMIIGR